MVRCEIVLFMAILTLLSYRNGCHVPTNLGPGYGRPEQQRGYYGPG